MSDEEIAEVISRTITYSVGFWSAMLIRRSWLMAVIGPLVFLTVTATLKAFRIFT